MRTQLQTKLSVSKLLKKKLANVSTILKESVVVPPVGKASTEKKQKGRKKDHKNEPYASPLSRGEQLAATTYHR